MIIANFACCRLVECSAWKHNIEYKIRLCEQSLHDLRQELLEANNDVRDVESSIEILRNAFHQIAINACDEGSGLIRSRSPTSSDSDVTDGSEYTDRSSAESGDRFLVSDSNLKYYHYINISCVLKT